MNSARNPYVFIVGLDYGTSFSKLVVREDNQQRGMIVTDAQGRYLLPSVMGYSTGKLFGPMCDPCPNAIPFLKMITPGIVSGASVGNALSSPVMMNLFMMGNKTSRFRALLAWQFTYFLSAMYDFLVKRSPWTDFDPSIDVVFVNIGVPTGYFTDPACERLFHEALCLAYLLATDFPSLSAGDGSVNLPEWEDACERAMLKIDSVRNQLCYTYPEVAAGVQCVMRSSTAMDGLYITLDVGAGTLDMNAFLRHTAQGWKHVDVRPKDLNYYAARVSDHGIARLGNQLNRHPFCEYPHLTKCISADSGYKLISRTDLFKEILQEVSALKSDALTRQPNHGQQGQKRTWDSCRVYGWGGGMYHESYQSCLKGALASWIHEVDLIHLPNPQQLELPRNADFNRLAIAYGLSFPKVNLEKIKLPEETPPMDVTPRKAYLPETPDDPGFSTMDRYED